MFRSHAKREWRGKNRFWERWKKRTGGTEGGNEDKVTDCHIVGMDGVMWRAIEALARSICHRRRRCITNSSAGNNCNMKMERKKGQNDNSTHVRTARYIHERERASQDCDCLVTVTISVAVCILRTGGMGAPSIFRAIRLLSTTLSVLARASIVAGVGDIRADTGSP